MSVVTSVPKRSRRGRRLAALLTLLAVTAFVLLWFTPLLGVRSVEVSGVGSLVADEVQQVAAIEVGTPMLRADVAAATDRLAQLDEVRTATVTRAWPWTVRIDIAERTVAAVMASGEQWRAFDVDGTEFARLDDVADEVPRLDPGRQGASARTVSGMLKLFAAAPPELQGEVQRLNPISEQDLRMVIAGSEVRFGSADDAAEKVRVLIALRQAVPGAAVYDVTAPDAPAAR